MERWYLQITEKFLFWTFRRWKIRSFFQPKSWLKDDIYWLLKSSCFELFWDGKYDLFLSQKVDGKMVFTWSFWVFHDILGPGKYGFPCSEGDRSKNDCAYMICKFVRGMKFVHGKRYIYFFFSSTCYKTKCNHCTKKWSFPLRISHLLKKSSMENFISVEWKWKRISMKQALKRTQ